MDFHHFRSAKAPCSNGGTLGAVTGAGVPRPNLLQGIQPLFASARRSARLHCGPKLNVFILYGDLLIVSAPQRHLVARYSPTRRCAGAQPPIPTSLSALTIVRVFLPPRAPHGVPIWTFDALYSIRMVAHGTEASKAIWSGRVALWLLSTDQTRLV
jgi:hypothetical protein